MQLKRKGVEDAIAGDPSSEQAPSKRLRQEWGLQLPSIVEDEGPCPIVVENGLSSIVPEVCPIEVASDAAVPNSPQAPLFVTEPDAEDKALVLYKPMSSSPRLHVKRSTFPKNYKDFQVSDAVDWFSPSKSFRHDSALCSSSSTSNNNLAVIPYVAPYAVFCESETRPGTDSYGGRVIIEDITDQVDQENAADAMVVEDSAAEPMDADAMDAMDVSPAAAAQLPPGGACDGPPYWQRFGSPQYTVMWS